MTAIVPIRGQRTFKPREVKPLQEARTQQIRFFTIAQVKALHSCTVKIGSLSCYEWNIQLTQEFLPRIKEQTTEWEKYFGDNLFGYFLADFNSDPHAPLDDQIKVHFANQFISHFNGHMTKFLKGKICVTGNSCLNEHQVFAWTMTFIALKKLSIKIHASEAKNEPYQDLVDETNAFIDNVYKKFHLPYTVVVR